MRFSNFPHYNAQSSPPPPETSCPQPSPCLCITGLASHHGKMAADATPGRKRFLIKTRLKTWRGLSSVGKKVAFAGDKNLAFEEIEISRQHFFMSYQVWHSDRGRLLFLGAGQHAA